MSLEDLIVQCATEAQAQEVILRNAGHWGAEAGISVDDYVKLSTIIHQEASAQAGGLETWVLVPKDDPETKKFYASCLTLTRGVLTLQPDQSSPCSGFGHSIFSLLVLPEHRGKGYGKCLMSLLHSVLAPHRYPNPLKARAAAYYPSTVSVLYSFLGDYYSRCAPSAGESGWSTQKSFITNWALSGAQIAPTKENSPPVELLSESDAASALELDDLNVPGDLLELQNKNPKQAYFAFVPTAPLNAHCIKICKLYPGPSNPSWGAKIQGGGDFMTWIIFSLPKVQLVITRLRATIDTFPALLNAAFQAAQDAKCEGIEAWSLPESLAEIARVTGGETTERVGFQSAFKWYGQPNLATISENVVWVMDERYCSF